MENYTIDQAIAECKEFAKETNMFVGDPHAAKIAEWLQKLESSVVRVNTYLSISYNN